MKKTISLIAAFSSALLLATACGDTDEQPDVAAETTEQEENNAQSEELDEFLRGFYALEPGWEGGEPGHWTTWVNGTHVDGNTLNVNLDLAPGHPDVNQRAEEAANAIGNQIRANQPESAEGLHSIRVNDNQGNRVLQENI